MDIKNSKQRLDSVPSASTIRFEYKGNVLEGFNCDEISNNEEGEIKVVLKSRSEDFLFLPPDTLVEVLKVAQRTLEVTSVDSPPF